MGSKFDFDCIIIGSGAAGSAAAFAAAKNGKTVAFVESGSWGGASLNTRDIPHRAMLNFAHLYTEAVQGSRFGLSSRNLRFNYPTALNWQASAVRRSGAGDKKPYEKAGITCFHGPAYFLTPYEISVGTRRISSGKILIATGAQLSSGGITGLEEVGYLSPDKAIRLNRPPKTIFIVGGGPTGCELAQYFAELGSHVLIADPSDRLLPREDKEIGQVLGQYFEERLGIKVLTESRVVALEKDKISKKVIFIRGKQEKFVRVDDIILAAGFTPSTDFGLENAGIKLTKTGAIKVNEYLQTSIKHIFAAGDCLGSAKSSTERSAYEGSVAVANMFSRSKNLINYSGFIRTVNTLPQIAITGITEETCIKKGRKYKKIVVPLSDISASNTSDFRVGFCKIITDKKDHVLGASLMCPSAENVIQELALAVRHQSSVIEIASTPHVASSWSEIIRQAARKLAGK